MQGQSDTLNFLLSWKKKRLISFHFKKGSQTNQLSQQGLGLRSFECLCQSIHMVLSQYSGQYMSHIQRIQHTHTHSFCYEAQSEMSYHKLCWLRMHDAVFLLICNIGRLPMSIYAHVFFPPNCWDRQVSPDVEITYYYAYSYWDGSLADADIQCFSKCTHSLGKWRKLVNGSFHLCIIKASSYRQKCSFWADVDI